LLKLRMLLILAS